MFKYKHIQAAHEIRMWIIMLAAGGAIAKEALDLHPEVKYKFQNAIDKLKCKVTGKQPTEPQTKEKIVRVVIVREGES